MTPRSRLPPARRWNRRWTSWTIRKPNPANPLPRRHRNPLRQPPLRRSKKPRPLCLPPLQPLQPRWSLRRLQSRRLLLPLLRRPPRPSRRRHRQCLSRPRRPLRLNRQVLRSRWPPPPRPRPLPRQPRRCRPKRRQRKPQRHLSRSWRLPPLRQILKRCRPRALRQPSQLQPLLRRWKPNRGQPRTPPAQPWNKR